MARWRSAVTKLQPARSDRQQVGDAGYATFCSKGRLQDVARPDVAPHDLADMSRADDEPTAPAVIEDSAEHGRSGKMRQAEPVDCACP